MILVFWFLFGLATGWLGFASCVWTVIRLNPQRGGAAWVTVGAYLRWALVAASILLALRDGALSAVAVVVGYTLAQWGLAVALDRGWIFQRWLKGTGGVRGA